MELILWRHAEAEEGSNDLARGLTRRGQQQAGEMAAWLRPRLPDGYRVFASQAKRSQQTAAVLSKSYQVLSALNPDANAEDILRELNWPRAPHPIVLVGHQPYLGQIAAKLLSGEPQFWAVKKAAFWWLQHRTRHNIEQTILKASLAPSFVHRR